MKNYVTIILAAIVFAAVFKIQIPVCAAGSALELAGSACVYNTESGMFTYEHAASESTQPAATAKLMTAILALEHYENELDRVITVSSEAVELTIGNSIGLEAGEEVTVDELLYALIAGGANDAANIFALELAGDIDSFCDMMNKKAADIGAVDTRYGNACGIDSDTARTTAHNVALITAYAYKLSGFREYASVTRYVMPSTNKSKSRVIHNRNYLLSTHIESKYYDSRAIGMNTGYTSKGGFCTVSVAEKNGLTYIFVVMKAAKDENGDNSSFYSISELMDMTLDSYGYVTVLDPSTIVREIPVSLAKSVDYVIASPKEKAEYFLPLDTDISSEMTYDTVLDTEHLTAPIYEGQRVGAINVIYKGEVIASVDLVTQNNVSASTLLRLLDYFKNLLKSRHIRIALGVFVLLFISYLFISYRRVLYAYKRKNKRK